MDVLGLVKYPDRKLRMKCQPIEWVRERERILFQQMLFTMRHFNGIGLAAPQIGIAEQIIVADIGEGEIALANPKIIKSEGNDALEEGCLSLPDIQVTVLRRYEITVVGINKNNDLQEIKTQGLMARVVQHEMEHLNGRLIIDYLSWWKRISFEMKR